jgi:hypothetical protein
VKEKAKLMSAKNEKIVELCTPMVMLPRCHAISSFPESALPVAPTRFEALQLGSLGKAGSLGHGPSLHFTELPSRRNAAGGVPRFQIFQVLPWSAAETSESRRANASLQAIKKYQKHPVCTLHQPVF